MGTSSKPLIIHVAYELYRSAPISWDALREQGFDIQVIGEHAIDLYLAPYAMRMTTDMLVTMPASLQLAIKGARVLRYAPQGTSIAKGKSSAKVKTTRKRKNSTLKVEASSGRTTGDVEVYSTPTREDQGVGDPAITTDTTISSRN